MHDNRDQDNHYRNGERPEADNAVGQRVIKPEIVNFRCLEACWEGSEVHARAKSTVKVFEDVIGMIRTMYP